MKTYTIITQGDVLWAVAQTTEQAISEAFENANQADISLAESDLTIIENVVLTDDEDEVEGETVWAAGGFNAYLPDENGKEYRYAVKIA